MKIADAITCSIVAVNELRELESRDEEVIRCACYGVYYLITETCKEFGVTRKDIVNNLIDMGYPNEIAIMMIDKYEKWAQKIKVSETKRNTEHC